MTTYGAISNAACERGINAAWDRDWTHKRTEPSLGQGLRPSENEVRIEMDYPIAAVKQRTDVSRGSERLCEPNKSHLCGDVQSIVEAQKRTNKARSGRS